MWMWSNINSQRQRKTELERWNEVNFNRVSSELKEELQHTQLPGLTGLKVKQYGWFQHVLVNMSSILACGSSMTALNWSCQAHRQDGVIYIYEQKPQNHAYSVLTDLTQFSCWSFKYQFLCKSVCVLRVKIDIFFLWKLFISCLFADRGKGAGPLPKTSKFVCSHVRTITHGLTITKCTFMHGHTQPEQTDWTDRPLPCGKGDWDRRVREVNTPRERKWERWGLLELLLGWLELTVTVSNFPDLAAIRLAVCLLFFWTKKCIEQCACCR